MSLFKKKKDDIKPISSQKIPVLTEEQIEMKEPEQVEIVEEGGL